MAHSDTIVATATAPGRGGIGVVRLSGAKVPEIAAVLLGELPPARRATLGLAQDGPSGRSGHVQGHEGSQGGEGGPGDLGPGAAAGVGISRSQ